MSSPTWLSRAQTIEEKISQVPVKNISFGVLEEASLRRSQIERLVEDHGEGDRQRIQQEFFGFGPVEVLLRDKDINEIIILGPNEIWFEKRGRLQKHQDVFASETTFQGFVDLLCERARLNVNLENPMANGKLGNFRIHIISDEITQTYTNITLRQHPDNPWTLQSLAQSGWAEASTIALMQRLVSERKNFLIVGATGSGKTSLINACLQSLPENERVVILEDTSELAVPNPISTKLISRFDANGLLKHVDLSELTRQALRMRPDRLVLGEVRGPEAKDLLMALSTGHEGSFASLHASTAKQALIRLEMLIQLGAPDWSLWAIRNLICLSLNFIVVVQRNPQNGQREFQSLYELKSLEDTGILLERVDGV